MNTTLMRLKRLLTPVMAVLLVLTVCSCGAGKDEQAVRAVVDNTMAVFQGANGEELSKYLAETDLQTLEQLGIDPSEFYSHVFKNLSYTIDGVSIDGNTAQVKLSVKNVNLDDAAKAALEEFQTWVDSKEEAVDVYEKDGEQGLYNKLFQLLYAQIDKLAENDLVTTEATLYLEKQEDGTWDAAASGNDEFYSALYGGSSFSDTFTNTAG